MSIKDGPNQVLSETNHVSFPSKKGHILQNKNNNNNKKQNKTKQSKPERSNRQISLGAKGSYEIRVLYCFNLVNVCPIVYTKKLIITSFFQGTI